MCSARVWQVETSVLPRCGEQVTQDLIHSAAEFRGPGVHHRTDDSADDLDMEFDHRFRPGAGNGMGSRIILLGDGSELHGDVHDTEMFDQDDEDKDLESQVDKYHTQASSNGANPSEAPQTTESPSSVKTEQSDAPTQDSAKDVAPPAQNRTSGSAE